MGQQQHVATRIQVDNKSAIAIAKYSVSKICYLPLMQKET
jgi:hypothetical protein